MQTSEQRTMVVVGAGYAGVMAANRLAGRVAKGDRIVLVNERDEFVHRVRLHEVAAGVRTQRYGLGALVSRRVERVRARVVRIEAEARRCVLQGEDGPAHLDYDYLIYAVGSGVSTSVPGARERGMALAGHEQAARFAVRLRALPEGAPVVVVGTGLSGIETAAEIAEAFPGLAVTLLGEALAPDWDAATRAHARAGLEDLGVSVRTGVRVERVAADAVVLAGGEAVPAAALVWAAGFSANRLAADSGLPVDASGRLVLDESLRAPEHPEIVGCGDAVAVPLACAGTGITPLRMACATAFPLGVHAAEVVAAARAGRPVLAFRYRNTVQCVSLGRRRGLLVFIDQDDRPTGRVMTGRRGALAKELICRLVIGALRLERRLPGFYRWPGQGARRPAELGAGAPARMLPNGDTMVS